MSKCRSLAKQRESPLMSELMVVVVAVCAQVAAPGDKEAILDIQNSNSRE
eukprot:COSAG02_NODE_30_length_50867_cov_66.594331_3_plen_50_part_00